MKTITIITQAKTFAIIKETSRIGDRYSRVIASKQIGETQTVVQQDEREMTNFEVIALETKVSNIEHETDDEN